ncbi:MAG: hypothetical protein U1F43_08870 [Myxococcota bacterium]
MFGRYDDVREIPDYSSLDKVALERAVMALKYLDQFHTLDVTTHMYSLEAHREQGRSEEFIALVTRWLTDEATRLGLRGPLPGHPSRGDRWAWYQY